MKSAAVSQVDLRRMRVAVEVARAEAITTAAETLGLTQSAVSRTVAELEDALGVRLFDRLPRGIQVTAAGLRFVERARRVLADIDDMVVEIGNTAGQLGGRLRLGIAAVGTLVSGVCATFAARHPDVAIETVHASDQALCPRALNGELDLLIGSANYLGRWRELSVTPLAPLHFACMMRQAHPLTTLAEPTELDVLAYPVLLPESIEAGYSDIAERFRHHGLPPLRPRYVTNDPALIDQLLRATDAVFPMMHPRADFGGLGKRFHLLHGVVKMPQHFISFACPAQRPQNDVVKAFAALLIAQFADPNRA